jgi:hypothetical protein
MLSMVTFRADTCDKCKNASPISYRVEPEEAWRAVVLYRWRRLCPGCFDIEAEKAGVHYRFADLDGMSWSDRPVPKTAPGRGESARGGLSATPPAPASAERETEVEPPLAALLVDHTELARCCAIAWGYPFGIDRAVLVPHRALSDAIVTAAVFVELTKRTKWSDLVHWSAEAALYTRLPLGMYRGMRFDEVPEDYLRWILEGRNELREEIKASAAYWLEKRTTGAPKGTPALFPPGILGRNELDAASLPPASLLVLDLDVVAHLQ